MADSPTDYTFYHKPLRAAIETQPGSGDFVTDPRIAVEKVTLGSNEIPSRAILKVYAGPIDSRYYGSEPSMGMSSVLNAEPRQGFGMPFIRPDQEILIFIDRDPAGFNESEQDELAREVIFSGYCSKPSYEERTSKTSARPQSERGFNLTVESMLERLSNAPQAQIIGRYMRTAKAQTELDKKQERSDTEPHGDLDSVAEIRAEQCIFNAEGKPNRAAAPIKILIGTGEDATEHWIHVFTYDGDPFAKPWTFAQALRYLVFFHAFESHKGDDIRELAGPVKDGNIFETTEYLAEDAPEQRPVAPVSEDYAWTYAMLGEPRNMVCEKMNLPEALLFLADASGTRFQVRTESEADVDGDGIERFTGKPVNRLYFQARGAGPEKTLRKAYLLAEQKTQKIPPDLLLEMNNIIDLSIHIDYDDLITNPRIVGDVRRYEVTVELVPGWLPDDHLDNIKDTQEKPNNIKTELDYADLHNYTPDAESLKEDPWYQRYHKAGNSFENHAEVGRRWVLNETGYYYGQDLKEGEKLGRDNYARTIEPFKADAYKPWGPNQAQIKDNVIKNDGTIEEKTLQPDAWALRPRPFQECFSADGERKSLGIYVEFSFDSGTTWANIPEVRIVNLKEEAGIYIDADDLTRIVEPGDLSGKHFWEVMLRGEARMRVTAVIEGDERLEPNISPEKFHPLITRPSSRIFDLSTRFHSNRRYGANSQFAPPKGQGTYPQGERTAPGETTETADDLDKLQRAAEGIVDLLSGRQMSLSVAIPYLTTEYEPLDSVSRIEGAGIELYSHDLNRQSRRTDIVAVEYVGAHTRLIFEDDRTLEQIEF